MRERAYMGRMAGKILEEIPVRSRGYNRLTLEKQCLYIKPFSVEQAVERGWLRRNGRKE